MPWPYVGITGFTEQRQVESALDYFARLGLDSTRRLMVGVLVSYKSLTGQTLKAQWQFKYPSPESINDIFMDCPMALNLIHYNSKEPELADQLVRLMELAPRAHGVQLNIAWPNPGEIARFKQVHPDKVVVLQISERAMSQIGQVLEGGFNYDRLGDVRLLNRTVSGYADTVDYFLPDLSGGVGEAMDSAFSGAVVAGQLQCPNSPLPVVAGGLDGRRLERLVAPILRLCPWVSWDAEGRLFNGSILDLERCHDYLVASAKLISTMKAEPRRHPTTVW